MAWIRMKIEYLSKNMKLDEYKELLHMLDSQNSIRFNPVVQDFLMDPATTDPDKLAIVPCSMLGQEYIDRYINKYRKIFRDINTFCMEHRTHPLFPDPDDVTASLLIRNDLVDPMPEDFLNGFFGVKSYDEYTPSVYQKPQSEE